MKTSNKLLIAFASAIILIPILGLVYISRVEYKVGKYTDIVERKIENFSTATKNMTAVAVSTAFQSVNIDDAKGTSIGIRFVKDEKFGIKIPDAYKDLITAQVDATGQLQVAIKTDAKNQDRDYVSILVYAPSLKEVNIANANGSYVTADTDSLTLNVKNSASAGIGSGSHLMKLNLNAVNVPSVRLSNDDVKSLDANLQNTNFMTEQISYDNLKIATSGACDVEIRGDYNDNDNKYTIQKLVVNTVGKADVKLHNIKAMNCSGSFSDETDVQMPAANLKQMFKR
jgi:hypothetical protein